MQEFYHTLTVRPSAHHELFGDFLSDTLPIGFEETEEGFIVRSEDELDTIAWGLEQFNEALQRALTEEIDLELTLRKEKNEDWVRKYQQGITAVEVAPFYIHPSWETPKLDALNIVLDPALAFGTGHHPTTASCLRAIDSYVRPAQVVVDVGCGSGILGIAAIRKGAIVDACDTDIVSVENSRENAQNNGVAFEHLWEGSIASRPRSYDVVIANIVADVLVMIAFDLKKALGSGGVLILSGILDKYEDKVLKTFSDMELLERIVQDEWVTLVVRSSEGNSE